MFNSIRVKFSLMFAIMATALIVMAVTDAIQSRATVKQMQEFSQLFNPAISAILNADRDLYQAQLSEEVLLREELSAENRKSEIDNWQENVDQARDRMGEFKKSLKTTCSYCNPPMALKRNFPFGIKPHQRSLTQSKVTTLRELNSSTRPSLSKNLKP